MPPRNKLATEEQLAEAGVLSQALPFIRRFNGSTFVIKYGGHAMGDATVAKTFARNVVLLKQVGINPIVVHGGGPQIGRLLERLKIKSNFVKGLRVTDQETVGIVEMVLSGSINKAIVSSIGEAGGTAVGLSGKDGNLIVARKIQCKGIETDSNIEKVLDLGFVGEPVRVDPYLLETLGRSNIIPVIAPIGVGPAGETYNINADTVAGHVAAAIRATRLLLLTDVPGVLDASKNLIPDMTIAQAQANISDGTITGGMIPKIETCIHAVEHEVDAAVIIDGRTPHALLLEIFTDAGLGTAFWPG